MEKKGIALQTNALKDHNAMGVIDNFAKRLKLILNATAIKNNSVRWIDQVDGILKRYNNTPNSAIADKTPNQAEESGNYQEILDLNVEKDKGNHATTDLKPGDKVRTNILKNDANSKGTDPKWSSKVHTVKETIGKTITLDSDVRHKRHDLLKVPHDAEDLPENIITKTRKENTGEARKIKMARPAFKEKMKRLLEKKKKERADFKAQQEMEAADQQVRDDQAAADKKAKEAKDASDKKAKEEAAELKKAQDLWNLAARTRTPSTPYPATKEQMDANKKLVIERAKQAIKDKADRERKAKELKDRNDKIKAENKAFKKK